ncbi:MAG: Potassium efflux system KefA protein / Small-conductance mechanosensitive channel [Labilithrix sp.]|nr:Potassium efflux system KefA protein / Small-conductance mechanosensitive channel [Labilithrix sp.]
MRSEIIWALGLLAGTVLTATVVNALAPGQRVRVRRIVILYVVYAVALAVHFGLEAAGSTRRAGYFMVAAELLQSFTLVNIAVTLCFAVVLPRLRLAVPMIASDLTVGLCYLLATLGVLAGHGFNPTGLLATSAVVSAVLAISLQSTLGNILGGVALQLDGSINEGDWIQLDNGKQGRVRQVRWRHTVVETRDSSTIIVPNQLLLAGNITILGKRDGRAVPQRMWVWFNVDFRFPPTRVIQVVSDALRGASIDNVAADPVPSVVCMDFTKEMRESFATYAVRYWILDLAADDPTSSRVRARIYTALRRADIPLAVPAHTTFLEVQDADRVSRRGERRASERLEALRHVSLFRHLKENELETLAGGMGHLIYTAGEIITRQGATAHWLYVLTSGSAEVRASIDPDGDGPAPAQVKTIATLQAPAFFGEMGLMTGEPRTADVLALTDVECFRLGKETFQEVLLARPEIANELSENMATRRLELMAVRDGLGAVDRLTLHASERDRILSGIKDFFGL